MSEHEIQSAQPLMTDREVAKMLKRSPGTLRNDRMRGRGPKFVKLGRQIRYRLEDVMAYIESGGGTIAALLAGIFSWNWELLLL
jgi:predicted DNA-binding transcriptional regulator AlpA